MLLDTLSQLGQQAPVLAAGDFNESRRDDLGPDGQPRGTWAQEFFEAADRCGLMAPLHVIWQREQPTRAGLQLDHVLLSKSARTRVLQKPMPALDETWAKAGAADLSDHTPIWFSVTL